MWADIFYFKNTMLSIKSLPIAGLNKCFWKEEMKNVKRQKKKEMKKGKIEKQTDTYVCVYVCVYTHTHIYIYN